MAKIGVVGDSFVDRYWVGVNRGLSAEAPIPVVDIIGTRDFPGGAGNVKANLTALGYDSVMLYHPDPNLPVKNRLVVGDVQIARWDERDFCKPFNKIDLLALFDCDALVVVDYGKGAISEEVIQTIRDLTCPIFVDTKKSPEPWVGSKAILFPNHKEYDQYREVYGWMENVVLKMGRDGVALLQFGRPVMQSPSRVAHPVSVCGAGDTVLAASVGAYLAGCTPQYCLDYAMAAAAVVCQKPFTAVATEMEVQEVLNA